MDRLFAASPSAPANVVESSSHKQPKPLSKVQAVFRHTAEVQI